MKNTVEAELAKEKVDLEELTAILDVKERVFEELSRTFKQFQQRYASMVGDKQVELNRLHDELDLLMSSRVPYGRDVKHKSSGVGSAGERPAQAHNDVNTGSRSEIHSGQEVKEVKRLYRKIAAIIHPDKATEDGSRPLRTRLMAELNEAYALKDTAMMHRVFDEWKESPESVVGDGADAERIRTQRAIAVVNRRLLEIETEMTKIIHSDLYILMLRVRDSERAGRDVLAEMTASIDVQIKDAQNKLLMRMYG